MSHRERLIGLLAQKSYREGDFALSSGVRSDFYLDAKLVTYHPDGVRLVGHAILDALEGFSVEAVGGLTMGADAIVASTVWAALESGRKIPGFVVRKEPKKHGLQKWIEGVSPQGLRVAIVDDVITSGKSVLKAVEAAREAGAEVVVVVGLVDREEGGARAIQDHGVAFRSVCTIAEIRAAAKEELGVPAQA